MDRTAYQKRYRRLNRARIARLKSRYNRRKTMRKAMLGALVEFKYFEGLR